MEAFKAYSDYYDLLYKGKDYYNEAKYVCNNLKSYNPKGRTILNLGCGTGMHDIEFLKLGYKILATDISNEMISIAKKWELKGTLDFKKADARVLRVKRKFDFVVSLFHVINYQTDNSDLLSFFETAYFHLEKGGLFIFDSWYGPAVLGDLPTNREKIFENNNLKIKRSAIPKMDFNANRVSITFNVKVIEKKTKKISTLQEQHDMRYLFYPEVKMVAERTGFKIVGFKKWLTDKTPDKGSWYVLFALKKE
ncbi:MAG TPA: class I SAM-dependent methyltransferase [Chitinophagaceae bacterium]|nr:class I SAM-dependent methyltransferase [Chitinophagaceae bacterium]